MSKKSAQPTAPARAKPKPDAKVGLTHRMIAENRKARHRYEILDSVECGIVLHGSEVKSLRDGKCSLEEAYGRIRNGELWLVGCDIGLYKPACTWNHEPTRVRKMLMHKREFLRISGKASQKGLTLVPLKMYFNDRGLAKCVMGLCRGLKQHDKREILKKNDAQREIQRAMRRK